MNETIQNIPEQEKEALKFLDRDFNQCFEQMRHKDSQIFDILKFMFTAYPVLIGVSLGLYQFGLEKNVALDLPAIAALSVGLVLGLSMFALAIRNRVYYVKVVRYINEQRGLFFKYKPLGFVNKSTMYTNHTQPPFFKWHSSQTWLAYIIAFLNSTLFGVLLFIIFVSNYYKWLIVGVSCIALFNIQLWVTVLYLKSQEK